MAVDREFACILLTCIKCCNQIMVNMNRKRTSSITTPWGVALDTRRRHSAMPRADNGRLRIFLSGHGPPRAPTNLATPPAAAALTKTGPTKKRNTNAWLRGVTMALTLFLLFWVLDKHWIATAERIYNSFTIYIYIYIYLYIHVYLYVHTYIKKMYIYISLSFALYTYISYQLKLWPYDRQMAPQRSKRWSVLDRVWGQGPGLSNMLHKFPRSSKTAISHNPAQPDIDSADINTRHDIACDAKRRNMNESIDTCYMLYKHVYVFL